MTSRGLKQQVAGPPQPGEPTLLVSELFYSLQGESRFAGYPCLFVRLSGCNLRCSYCDAAYTYREPGRAYSLTELLAALAATAPPGKRVELVEVTGGEPLLQEGVYPLLEALLAQGHRVLLETNGTVPLSRVPAAVCVIMDIKCPASGMAQHFLPANLQRLTTADEIKFVVGDQADYQWARQLIRDHHLAPAGLATGPALTFSPVVNRLPPAQLAAWLMADVLPARLQLQLHTQLWPHRQRGV